jgi:steroid 5-alpha reductase family enzyme
MSQFRIEILFNYSIAATIVLTLLFQGSTMLTEKITLEKYPEYAKYKKRVSRLLPWFTSYRPVSLTKILI